MSQPQVAMPLRVVLVTGLSGAGKLSVLRVLEDLGYETVDNPPLTMMEEMVARGERRLAIGVDARTRGFDADHVLDALARLRANQALRPELVYVTADETVLLRRYTETRRRHPLAPQGRVIDGVIEERRLTARLRDAADLLIDTSELPLADMRALVERHFASDSTADAPPVAVTLISFAYPLGLPRDADLVFDARFLRNPHYDPMLRARTGLDPEVAAYIEADPDFAGLLDQMGGLLGLLLPRFVQEGKKYVTIAVGCTGGRHRSVHVVERLAARLASRFTSGDADVAWRVHIAHRELTREEHFAAPAARRPDPPRDGTVGQSEGGGRGPPLVQAQEA